LRYFRGFVAARRCLHMMPIYEYRCRNGHAFEALQSMSDDPVASCQECGAPVERVFHPVAVHFKGSGFYTTDYARKGKDADSGGGDSKAESKAEGKSKPAKGDKGKASGASD
jgi:putative FmdB family regulatory protein